MQLTNSSVAAILAEKLVKLVYGVTISSATGASVTLEAFRSAAASYVGAFQICTIWKQASISVETFQEMNCQPHFQWGNRG